MTEKTPRVSVVITCHNLGRYLREALDCVLRQTLRDAEIIVVDDSSDDQETVDILARLDAPKTRMIHVEKRNVAAARNCGVRESRGKYICCLDADDTVQPTFLEKTVAVLDKKPAIGFAGCWYEAYEDELWTFKPERASLNDFLVENRAPVVSVFRREAWEKVGGYDEQLSGYEDWEFWINILAHGYAYEIIKEVLFRYRVRRDSKIKQSNLPENRSVILQQIIKKHKDLFQENAVPVLIGKEKTISGILDYMRQMRSAQAWYAEQNVAHQKALKEITEEKEWLEQQLEQHKAEMSQQKADIAGLHDEIASAHAAVDQLNARLARQQHLIGVKEVELRSVHASKAWKLGCAFRDAKRSFRAALLLPFRVIDFACPEIAKRGIKRTLLIGPHETIKRNIHKFPFRLADRVLPNRLKNAIPYPIRNAARAIFRITDERLYKQKRWSGPLVSVIIPCYNYGRYIEEAIQSVRDQTFTNYEMIIVDDGSTDEFTVAKLREIENRRISNARVIHQANAGVSAARNNAIRRARGKYICCLDADDILHPTYLEKCLLVLEGGNLDLCYTHVQLFGDESGVWKTSEFDLCRLVNENCVSTAAVFKKTIWQKAGGYNLNMHHGWEDWDFWISAGEAGGRGALIPEPLFRYRRHGETRDVKAATQHSKSLLPRIRNNHPDLFGGRITPRRPTHYKVANPLINLVSSDAHAHSGYGCGGVLFLLPWTVIGGADSFLCGLAGALVQKGKTQVHIMTTIRPPLSMGDSMGDFLDVTPYIYRLPDLISKDSWYPYIRSYMRHRSIDAIFICGCSFIYPHLRDIKKDFPSLKVIDQIFNDSPMGHVQNNRRHAESIDLTVVPAEKIRRAILRAYGGDPARIIAVYHGADMRRFDPDRIHREAARKRFSFPPDREIILWVGRLSVEKNPHMFLDLAGRFRNEKAYLFVLRGNGPMINEIRKRAADLNIDNLAILDILPPEDMPYLYKLARLLVITSQTEGVPLTIFEALSMNVPVVASDVGGISDIIEEGKNGCLYIAGDRKALFEKTRMALATHFGDLRVCIRDRYDMRDVYARYMNLFVNRSRRLG